MFNCTQAWDIFARIVSHRYSTFCFFHIENFNSKLFLHWTYPQKFFSALTHYCRKENNFNVYLSCTRKNFLNICNNCLLYSLYSEHIPALIQFTQKQSWAILNQKLSLLKHNTFCSLIINLMKALNHYFFQKSTKLMHRMLNFALNFLC